MRATIRTHNRDQRTEDAKAAVAHLSIKAGASYEIHMSHAEPNRPTRTALSTLPGTSLPLLITAFLKSLVDEIEQDETGRITTWSIDPHTGAETRHVFTAA
ncbi:hypothetical protein [Streptomyces sp. DH8]|uniref:hypothetical protein n=1 Tax=Streptomyces sp. DH8 TaxID=2857008 RepID=UPI001E2CE477|nr:hypothetical protein [Streptomyces sp. DH8]